MRISIDPETGEIVVPPPSAQSPAGAPRAAQLPPLEVVPGTSPAGGEMIDLQERFHTSVVTSVGGDGEATTECLESGGKGTR